MVPLPQFKVNFPLKTVLKNDTYEINPHENNDGVKESY